MNDTGSQRGQTLVLITVFMFSLLGMCALAIDVGSWYQQKRAAQSAADAGALAGAESLPGNWAAATTAAGDEVSKNMAGAAVTYKLSSVYVQDDSITVTVSRPAKTYFASMFTTKPVVTTTSATATMINAGGGALPWGVVDKPYVAGQTYPIYIKGDTANNGSIRLPAWDTSSMQCVGDNGGASIYDAEITGGQITTCPVRVGDVFPTKPGVSAGPTQQAFNARCPSPQPASSIVSFPGAGTPTILQPSSCQLVLLPTVLDDQTSLPVWPQGQGDVRVVSFSWWVLTGVQQGGKEVDAVYVGVAPITATTANGLPSAYDAQLTG
jgi:hypothetical protein